MSPFNGLSKIHKDNVPPQLIVSGIGSATCDIAKLMAFVLPPLVGNPQHSVQLCIKIKGIIVKPGVAITF